jgi:hypothetical protein
VGAGGALLLGGTDAPLFLGYPYAGGLSHLCGLGMPPATAPFYVVAFLRGQSLLPTAHSLRP